MPDLGLRLLTLTNEETLRTRLKFGYEVRNTLGYADLCFHEVHEKDLIERDLREPSPSLR
ncbi:hypothetical protein HS7_11930 [Sulfolobales archaeon HS-7]|nr:hypothetical protein HS7_11930 [Sulfolobales archaeon HS-7]